MIESRQIIRKVFVGAVTVVARTRGCKDVADICISVRKCGASAQIWTFASASAITNADVHADADVHHREPSSPTIFQFEIEGLCRPRWRSAGQRPLMADVTNAVTTTGIDGLKRF
ncbi:hypothetical protein EVAR_32568_1 [Eumeta japonica]|uniref:Uncharacterized protein n=1 Tax=Eumeta variegata TaxID=151549 RepID=A0A4C1VTI3_EUMVA|nr:hypothetical protein EVAR_32568_1 [Eumeta japonica]